MLPQSRKIDATSAGHLKLSVISPQIDVPNNTNTISATGGFRHRHRVTSPARTYAVCLNIIPNLSLTIMQNIEASSLRRMPQNNGSIPELCLANHYLLKKHARVAGARGINYFSGLPYTSLVVNGG